MNLINKDTLVAEIKKQIELGKFKCQQSQENNDRESYVAWSEHIATCGKILSFIDTLEVKEVDSNDVFIEKACHYLQKNIWKIIYEENEFRQRFVTDFENYMKE